MVASSRETSSNGWVKTLHSLSCSSVGSTVACVTRDWIGETEAEVGVCLSGRSAELSCRRLRWAFCNLSVFLSRFQNQPSPATIHVPAAHLRTLDFSSQFPLCGILAVCDIFGQATRARRFRQTRTAYFSSSTWRARSQDGRSFIDCVQAG